VKTGTRGGSDARRLNMVAWSTHPQPRGGPKYLNTLSKN